MTEPFDAAVGRWWRFEHYEVLDGLIRPAGGASLERYDPWQPFREAQARRGPQPPYRSLLNLVQDLTFQSRPGPGALRELTPEGAEKLAEWCASHGLLGVLPHEAVMVSLAASWVPVKLGSTILVARQREYIRTNVGWETYQRERYGAERHAPRDRPPTPGESIRPEDLRGDWSRPGVIIQPLGSSRYERKPLSETWSRFFPDVPKESAETYRYPAPLSGDFWRHYAEPVEDFVEAAGLLLKAVKGLGAQKPLTEAEEGDRERLWTGIETLHNLVRTVGPAMVPKSEGSLRQEWASTSLLGSFAMMALLDLTESRKVLTCEKCGKLFVTRAYQAKYCSSTCRYTAQKRRHRAKRKTVIQQDAS